MSTAHDNRNTDTDFYMENAGTSYIPAVETEEEGKYRNASELAYARGQADLKGWYYEWDDDGEPIDWGDVNPTDEERADAIHLYVVLRDERGRHLGSLGGIIVYSMDDPYLTVIEAELAHEALDGFTCGACGRTWLMPTPASRCPFEAHHTEEQNTESCIHCQRKIVLTDGVWIDPEAPATPEDGDDHMWRETCDKNDTITAEHEPGSHFDHVLTHDERVFIETSLYVSHEDGTTVREALLGEIEGMLWPQIEEPSERFFALADTMAVSEEDARALFDQLSEKLADAIRKVFEDA